MNYLDTLNSKKQAAKLQSDKANELEQIVGATKESSKEVSASVAKHLARGRVTTQPVQVKNADLAKTKDIQKLVTQITALGEILKPKNIDWQPVEQGLSAVVEQLKSLPTNFPKSPKPVDTVSVKNLKDLEPTLKAITKAVNSLKLSPVFDPQITVKPADVKITENQIDTEPIVKAVKALEPVLKALKTEIKGKDDTVLLKAVQATTTAINSLQFPVANYVLPFRDNTGKATQVTLDADGNLPVSATIDASDIQIGAVEIKNATTDDRATVSAAGALKVDGSAVTQPVSGTVTETNSAASLTALQLIDNIVSGTGANISQIGGTNIDTNSGNKSTGTQRVVLATDQPNLTTPLNVSGGGSATATGTTVARFTTLTNTAQAIKASAGNLYSYHLSNQANPAQDLYVHFYNVAFGSVTVGTTTPSRSFFLPGGAVIDTPYSVPMAFSTAMSVAVSTTATGGAAPTNTIYVHAEYL